MKPTIQRFRLYTYDLWSDGEGGLTVNDVFDQGIVEFRVADPEYGPTSLQIARAVGALGCTYDGDPEHAIYATNKRGNPAF